MAIALQQSQGIASTTSFTITAPQVGSLLTVMVGGNDTISMFSAISGGGVTWVLDKRVAVSSIAEIWSGADSSGSGTSIACTLVPMMPAYGNHFAEWTGADTASPYEGATTGSGSNTATSNYATGTYNTTTADDVAIAIGGTSSNRTINSLSNGYTTVAVGSATWGHCGYKITTGTNAESTQINLDGQPAFYATIIAAYKPLAVASLPRRGRTLYQPAVTRASRW